MNDRVETRTRSAELDLFKTLLVLGMIGAHVVQLLGLRLYALQPYADFIDLISFSGFMLAFGWGTGLSTTTQQRSAWHKLRPTLLILCAGYLSSLAFVLLVEQRELTGGLLVEIFTARRLFGWSEFLFSFFVLYLLLAWLRPALVALASNGGTLLLAILACLLCCSVVVSVDLPLLATLVGTTNFASFPLLPYLPWFLFGIYLGRHGLAWWHAVPAAFATAAFYGFSHHFGEPPRRFPPEPLWIIGPALWLLLYAGVARILARAFTVPPLLTLPGRRVLTFLLVSNLIIFAVRFWRDRPVRDTGQAALASIGIILVVGLIALLLEHLSRRRPAAQLAA